MATIPESGDLENPLETIQLEKTDSLAILTIDRQKQMNALNEQVLRELQQAFQELAADGSTRLVILTGAGPKAFVAGADIAVMQTYKSPEAQEFARLGHAAMNAVAGSNLITIAAINGFALGGGLELALACDMRLAAKTAKLGLPEVTLGLIPGFGGTQRLSRLVGSGLALEMILSGDMIDAERAAGMGLVNRVCEGEELMNEARALADKILKNRGPVAQRVARGLVYCGLDLPLDKALEEEIDGFKQLFDGGEPAEGLSAFLEKRKPNF